MSHRRSLSFAEDEIELLNYFDQNGRSDIGKLALKFYRDNKDKIIIGSLKEILSLVNVNNIQKQEVSPNIPKISNIQSKINKLIK